MKSIKAVYIPQLDATPLCDVAAIMEGNASRDYINEVNWPELFPYKPIVAFDVARGEKELYIKFFVKGSSLLAANTEYNSPVYEDSCVEFFAQVPGETEYYNFEFNCIGTALSSKRKSRTESDHYPAEQMAKIRTYSSAGNQPFEEKSGIHAWELVVAIPFEMFGVDANNLPQSIRTNFYKCGDKTSQVHYVSWNKIDNEQPNFHLPEFFGEVVF